MRHGFSDEEWEDYLLGKSGPEACARMDAHLVCCEECWQLYQQQYPTMSVLGDALEEAREHLAVPKQELRPMFSRIVANIREHDLATAAQIHNGLHFLRSVLDPVFGPTTAQRAIQVAGNRLPAQPAACITPENWDSFLERLAGIASVICGDVVASLIREHGQLALQQTAVV